MANNVVRLFAIAFTALALVPAGAHLMELPNKLHLPADRYLVVQQIYRGWALAGVLVLAALLSTVALAVMLRHQPGFLAAAVAVGCIAGTQIVFWSVTFPVNSLTHDWTVLPQNWQALRLRWEYSHAASALLNFAALCAATTAVLRAS